jgi:hypothetical protein
VAVRGGQTGPSWAWAGDTAVPGPHLIEGGPHQIFDTGAHPALTVDIGYADLTILTSKTPRIDVGLSAAPAFGFFGTSAPIAARDDGGTIRISTIHTPRWSTGDDRMVTVLVPPDTEVTVVNAGDIRADGLRAEASFNSIGSGSVTIDDYDAPTLRATSKGPITLHQVAAPHLDATSRDDRVEATALQVRDGTIESDDWVTLGFVRGADTVVTAETKDGKVKVSGFDADASVANDRKRDDDDDSSSQTVRVGDGDGRLYVHSSDGDITLAQEG